MPSSRPARTGLYAFPELSLPDPGARMIRLGLMLERSRLDECPSDQPVEARRARKRDDQAVWYLGVPFLPRRAAAGLWD